MIRKAVVLALLLVHGILISQEHTIARVWNEELLHAIRNDFARPVVHARNLWHTSIAMHDIWSIVTERGEPYLIGDTVGTYVSFFSGFEPIPDDEEESYVAEAISYAMYDLLRFRFEFAAKPDIIFDSIEELMARLGYDTEITIGSYPTDSSPAAFGRFVATEVILMGRIDGSNELRDYRNGSYQPANPAMLITGSGNDALIDPNRWQPLAFDQFIDQAGNLLLANIPDFLGAEWGGVVPFALSDEVKTTNQRGGQTYTLYHDPGSPPFLSTTADDESSEQFIQGFTLVGIWSSMLDPDDGVMWDISPRSIGNGPELEEEFEDYISYYGLFDGGDASRGRDINPITGNPYEVQMVPRGDYARVLAEFWADGPDSETPPGHWFTILHEVMDHPMFTYLWEGRYEIAQLEYDIRAFFTLGGAMHDAAIAAWGAKGWYDYIRPVSALRYMASQGQSSQTELDNYHPHGLPLIDGYIELIAEDETDIGDVGDVKILAWRGPDFIENPDTDVAKVGWIDAKRWWPYQRPTFVTPPFAGYVSGHSTFSRAAAEVLTMMTGDEYFPGGMGVFEIKQDSFLVFERGPSVDMQLQWATYRDASDQTSLSRIWGGIHPPQDDIPGRLMGIKIGVDAFDKALSFFDDFTTDTPEVPIVEDMISLYPNPTAANTYLHLDTSIDGPKEIYIEVFDMLGRRVRAELIRPNITSLDLRGILPGKYVVRASTSEKQQLEELVIVD